MSPRRPAALANGDHRTLRDHLIATAARLVAERGCATLTVRAIAREAGVADGVLYNHFTDKEELLALALHAHVRAAEQALGMPPPRAGEGTVADNLRAYVERALALHGAILPAFDGLTPHSKVLARFAETGGHPAGGLGLRGELREYLEAERTLGRLDPAARVGTAVTMIVGACHEVVLPPAFRGGGEPAGPPPEGFAADLAATVLSGIAARP
ncbi:TetR/AcrR family transcriptional regulator [Sphaerisporangium rufum]|nr:TetR/AcrR family transcriptional regulator [Sphaerisporangium rufum]